MSQGSNYDVLNEESVEYEYLITYLSVQKRRDTIIRRGVIFRRNTVDIKYILLR